MTVIDFHAHIYPDAVAANAAAAIRDFYAMPVRLDGTAAKLDALSREAGVTACVIHSVAVTPAHVPHVNEFILSAAKARPGRFLPFAALHPLAEDSPETVAAAKAAAFLGFKTHPDFQRVLADDPRSMDMYRAIAESGLPLLIHAGDYRYPYSRPERIANVKRQVPGLKLVCAHLGGWSIWEDALRELSGFEDLLVDTSSCLNAFTPEAGAALIRRWGAERVIYGTDYPMWTPAEELARFRALPLTDKEQEAVLHRNAAALLGI